MHTLKAIRSIVVAEIVLKMHPARYISIMVSMQSRSLSYIE